MKGPRGFALVGLAVVALLYVLHHSVTPTLHERNFEIFTEMVYSKANESFGDSTFLPGGRTQQPLVPGVVPRGTVAFGFHSGAEEAARAGRELANPFGLDDADAVADGRALYSVYCAPCHDAGGNGRGPVVERGMPPPPSLHGARARQMADGEMFHILTLGQGNMASYSAQLTPEERWKVILHTRKLQETRP